MGSGDRQVSELHMEGERETAWEREGVLNKEKGVL